MVLNKIGLLISQRQVSFFNLLVKDYLEAYNFKMNIYEAHDADKSQVIASVQKEYRKLVHQILD